MLFANIIATCGVYRTFSWGKRKENEVAWRVNVEDLKRGFDLDVKNPSSTVEENDHTVEGLLHQLAKRQHKIGQLIERLESALKGS